MRIALSALSKLDFFGHEHRIQYKRQESQKTAFGGCITVLVATCLGLIIGFLGIELFSRDKPVVLKGESEETEAKVKLSDLQSFFAIVDRGGNLLHLNPKFMNAIKLQAFILEVEDTETKIDVRRRPISLGFCSEDHLTDEYADIIKKNINRQYFLCPDIPEDLFVVNEFSTIGSRSFTLLVELCDETLNPGCREPLKQASGVQFIVNTMERYFDPHNFSTPIGTRILGTPTTIGLGLNVIRNLVIKINEAYIDDAIIFDSPQKELFYSTDASSVQSQLYSESENKIFELRVESTRVKNTYRRRYTKIQELIAFVGGIAKVVVFFGKVIGKTFSRCYFLRNAQGDFKWCNITLRQERDNSLVKLSIEKKKKGKGEVYLKTSWWILIKSLFYPQILKNTAVNEVLDAFDMFEIQMEAKKTKLKLEEIERQMSVLPS